ncbi:MAG: TonB-dependent receptor [Flavobacteriaceae bacterium]
MRYLLYLLLGIRIVLSQESTAPLELQLGNPNPNADQQSFLLSGNVQSQETGQPLTGVSVYVTPTNRGTVTDRQGNFRLSLVYGDYMLRIEGLGYATQRYRMGLYADGFVTIALEEAMETLDEVVVSEGLNENIESEMVGKSRLSVLETENIPLVLGEQNILKAATILPGISTAGEAATGFNVRGGKADQNLMLLNKGILINPNHFFGIFQALNPFVINSLNVYKGAIPIIYEGRTSSVFELTTKAPATDRFRGKVSVGPITANALLEVPIRKQRSGLMVGFRSAHSDWLMRALDDPKLKKSAASFSDGIVTYDDQLTDKDQINATIYRSNDAFQIASDSLYRYTNGLAAINWRHRFTPNQGMQLHASASAYDFSIVYDGNASRDFQTDFKMAIQSLRWQLNTKLSSKHYLTYGANAVRYNIEPGAMLPLESDDLIRPQKLLKESAIEGSIFFADRITFSDRWLFNLGFQGALYTAIGPFVEKTYPIDLPKSAETATSENAIAKGSFFAQKFYPTYRFSARYKHNDVLSVKFASLRIYQFIHSLTNNTTASPIDTWRISTNNLAPQASDQIAMGVFFTPYNKVFEMSIEGFYKRQENLVDFKTGASLFLNQFIETEVLQGKGKAYGVEFLLRKKKGKHTGWLGYTYARTLIQLESPFREERVNDGTYFPTNYDRPHDLSIIWNYAFHPKFNLSSNLIYQTGRPITIPNGNYVFNNAEYVLFSDRNQYRIPDFYRLDLGLNYSGSKPRRKAVQVSWSLSVYNVLGRNNPFSVFFITDQGQIKGRQSAIFTQPIPSFTCNFTF